MTRDLAVSAMFSDADPDVNTLKIPLAGVSVLVDAVYVTPLIVRVSPFVNATPALPETAIKVRKKFCLLLVLA